MSVLNCVRPLAVALGATLTLTTAACTAGSGTEPDEPAVVRCVDVLEAAFTVRGPDLDAQLETLRVHCADLYRLVVGNAESGPYLGIRFCAEMIDVGLSAADVERLHAAGRCLDVGTPSDAESAEDGDVPWSEAIHYVGTTQRVCGPLVSVRQSSDDVFLNVGRDYPDSSRFTIVIWDVGGIEPIDAGTSVCTTGLVSNYNGVAQIELRDPGDVSLYR